MILHLTRLVSLVKGGDTVFMMGALLLCEADLTWANPAFNPPVVETVAETVAETVVETMEREYRYCLKIAPVQIEEWETDRETLLMFGAVDRTISPRTPFPSTLSQRGPIHLQAESADSIENSPLFQRWQERIPNVLEDIDRDPSFRTRVRVGIVQSEDGTGIGVRAEEIIFDRSGLTLSGGYQRLLDEDRSQSEWDAELHYYLRPLGRSVNIAPVVGFREVGRSGDNLSGVNAGVRVLLVLSRGGGGEISATQTWTIPTSGESSSLTKLSAAYALDAHWRLSTDWQRQNREQQVGIFVEWMP
jgi:hypothetical protein